MSLSDQRPLLGCRTTDLSENYLPSMTMEVPLEDPDEGLGVSDDDMYDQEELEVALYSQIHFEDNTDSGLIDFTDPDDVQYDIKVEGNTRTGFLSYKMTSDCILNQQLKENTPYVKASPSVHGTKGEEKDLYNSLFKGTSLSKNEEDSGKKISKTQLSNDVQVIEEVKASSKKKQRHDTPLNKELDRKKLSVAEKLILGHDSGSESDSDIAMEIISSDNEDKEDPRYKSVSKRSRNKGRFIVDMTDDTDATNSDVEEDSGLTDNSDMQFNIIGGVLPSSSSDQAEESDMEDDWKISFTDTKHVRQNRYFKPVMCFNCKEKGHLSKSCPKPKKQVVCSLCSGLGHTYHNCLQPVCSNCLEQGHTFRGCRVSRHKLNMVCHRCKMEGHGIQKCPDIWRQFHLTICTTYKPYQGNFAANSIQSVQEQCLIEPNNFVKGRPRKDAPMSCYNCGGNDHFGHECEESRANSYVRLTTPFVCKYQPQQFQQELAATEVRKDEVEAIGRPRKLRKTNLILDRKDISKHLKRREKMTSNISDGVEFSAYKASLKRKSDKIAIQAVEPCEDYIEILDDESPMKKKRVKPTLKTKSKKERRKNKQSSLELDAEEQQHGNIGKDKMPKKKVSNYVPFIKKPSISTDRSNPKEFEHYNSENEQDAGPLFTGLNLNWNYPIDNPKFKSSKKAPKNKRNKNKFCSSEVALPMKNRLMPSHEGRFVKNSRGFKTNLAFKDSFSSTPTKHAGLENLQITIGNSNSKSPKFENKNKKSTNSKHRNPRIEKKKSRKSNARNHHTLF